jgi:hypothetical protein
MNRRMLDPSLLVDAVAQERMAKESIFQPAVSLTASKSSGRRPPHRAA